VDDVLTAEGADQYPQTTVHFKAIAANAHQWQIRVDDMVVWHWDSTMDPLSLEMRNLLFGLAGFCAIQYKEEERMLFEQAVVDLGLRDQPR
jgi:hypothetical protein